MTDREAGRKPAADSWDVYWDGTRKAGAYANGGADHPVVLGFWRNLFAAIKARCEAPSILDIASGNGAVVECAEATFLYPPARIIGVDVSANAMRNLQNRFPGVRGIVADARSIPLESSVFDAVTSQFGVEYAGPEAVDEAARLVAPGGRLALVIHHRSGGVHAECAAALDAMRKLQDAQFIAHSISTFEAGFAVLRGGNRAAYDAAAGRLAGAFRVLEGVMQQYGQQVAGDTVFRLYNDVNRMHEHIRHYAPEDVLGWLRQMDAELQAYAARMASMCDCAIDHSTFDRLCGRLQGCGYAIERAEPLAIPHSQLPIAWALVAHR
jgi:SAM-dependent methyltransferase